MIALMQRILRLAEGYQTRIRLAAFCSFIKALLSKSPIILAYFMIAWFLDGSMSGKNCILVGFVLLVCLALECLFQNLADRMQSGLLQSSPNG